jgi:uncharacterized membrane protein YbhN (UPF0104 family)
MFKKAIKIGLALLLAGVFLWLAFRNVKVAEVWGYVKTINLSWVLPLALTSLASHFLRAERWRLLIEHDKKELDRVTLMSGVMVGYMLNIVGPRLGEVSRPVYVGRREELSSSKLMGTIVLERIFDLATMMVLMMAVSIYVIADLSLLRQIFGDETIAFFTEGPTITTVLWVIVLVAVIAVLLFILVKAIRAIGRRFEKVEFWIERVEEGLKMFKDGILSARKVKRWWLFLTYTFLIWLCYTLMTYIPFWMFDMQTTFNLSFLDALVITVISAIGIAIPSPGGVGTYHYFVKQSLLILFAVPAVTGIAYATITHAAMVLMVATVTPVLLAIDKFRATKQGKPVV